ncbi:MAG: serine/threonine protein kinase [Elainellaceae cyanobacterium]
MTTDPNIGRKLNKRYEIVEILGQGSMGRVYGGRDFLLGGVPVAIKFLSQTLLNSRMRERFEREATTCALLGQRSIHIIRVTDYGVNEDGIPFYVMEYLRGESLSDVISYQPLPLPQFLNLIRQICLGLECAHQGILIDGEICPIIHRDIKPSNILITPDQSLLQLAKILDFGIAKTLQADGGQTNCFMGTLAYSSPEQMEGCELDNRSDIYSLGVMMFQMLTGKMPLQANTHTFPGWYKAHHAQTPRSFSEANPSITIPKALETLVMGCLEKSANNRPKSITDIIETLKPLEERFRPGKEVAERIGRDLKGIPIKSPDTRTNDQILSEDVCRITSWPPDKPLAEIVFPHILQTGNDSLATLWVMLSQRDIDKLCICTPYNKFLFLGAPHPVMLWLTVLYNRGSGPRWLSYYLDLKTQLGQRMTRLLSESRHYRILFFSLEDPHRCNRVMTLTIAEPAAWGNPQLIETQAKHLQEFATLGVAAPTKQPAASKTFLKAELEKIKPDILQKLEAIG